MFLVGLSHHDFFSGLGRFLSARLGYMVLEQSDDPCSANDLFTGQPRHSEIPDALLPVLSYAGQDILPTSVQNR